MLVLAETDDLSDRQKAHAEACERWFGNVAVIKSALRQGLIREAAEHWYSLPEQVQRDLWLSPRDGGIWTTQERALIKSTEFRKSVYEPQ